MMTNKQYQQVRKLLANDCELGGKNIDDKGRTCAVGCLLVAAGIPKKKIRHLHPEDSVEYLPGGWIDAIYKKFGLTEANLNVIQSRNDSVEEYEDNHIQVRRKKVVGVLRRFKK